MLSRRADVDNARIQRGELDKAELARVMAEAAKIHGSSVEFVERIPPSVDELCGRLRRLVKRNKARLLIVDYLQLIRAGRAFDRRQDSVDYVFGSIVELALSLTDCATLLVSQLRRTRGRRPTVEDLYHSGMLEQGSHTILLLWRPPINLPCACCDIAKQKNGAVGMKHLGWSAQTSSFFDPREGLARQYAEALKEYESHASFD
jgi:replicative DNA helicase